MNEIPQLNKEKISIRKEWHTNVKPVLTLPHWFRRYVVSGLNNTIFFFRFKICQIYLTILLLLYCTLLYCTSRYHIFSTPLKIIKFLWSKTIMLLRKLLDQYFCMKSLYINTELQSIFHFHSKRNAFYECFTAYLFLLYFNDKYFVE